MPAAPGQTAVLFDLDGTLTDPFVGISRSMQHALAALGYPSPEAAALRSYIGPPLQVTFPKLLASDDKALNDEALRLYRQRYADVGKFENVLIDGIVDALEILAGQGHYLCVATSKLETYSVEIVEHFGLSRFFRAVHGSALDGRNADKGELIGHIIETERLNPANTIMIGDRLHDIVGAARHGMRAIGVLWGFGDREELENAGAAAIAEHPSALPKLVSEQLSDTTAPA
jgi:phosphoglycolate phosphatase